MRPKKKSLLWQFGKEGGAGASYLFGTMHVQDMRAFAFLENAQEKILECGRLALEFDLAAAPAAQLTAQLQLPDGLALDFLFSAKAFAKMRRIFLKAVGLDIAHFRHVSPIVLANLINEQMLSRDMPVSLDEHLWQFARRHELPVVGIEAYEEQLEVLRQIPLEYQLHALASMARHLGRQRRQILHMAATYESGDIFKLYRAARRSASGLRGLLLYRRNQVMARRIALLAAEHPTFCAIGAGHLAGGKGVIRLLKQQGYSLSPAE